MFKMTSENNLTRFIEAQEGVYKTALKEIKNGKKKSHWMWYIFPQIAGLGYSETSKFYAIRNLSEAADYMQHPVLGKRLVEISSELLNLATDDAAAVFGSVDSLKLKSSMTLFSLLKEANPVFQKVLDKYFDGMKDQKTTALTESEG